MTNPSCFKAGKDIPKAPAIDRVTLPSSTACPSLQTIPRRSHLPSTIQKTGNGNNLPYLLKQSGLMGRSPLLEGSAGDSRLQDDGTL